MSFKFNQVEGNVEELKVDLESPPLHPREEQVVPAIKQAITEIVEATQGYLSVSCSGNLNPVAGESGDVINIYITSLPAPTVSTPAQTPPVEEVQTGEPTPVTEETPQVQPPVTPENVEPSQGSTGISPIERPVTITEVEATTDSGEVPAVVEDGITNDAPSIQASLDDTAETSPVIQENPGATEPTPAPENPAEIAPEVSPEANTTSEGQAEAQEIAQATPPVEPAV